MDPIAEIKQKIDVVDLISTYVPLTKSGRNYKGICPFHSEKTPSFMVSQELQLFKCFGCNQGGDIFKFVELIEGVDFRQALKQLAEKAGVKLEQNLSDKEEGNKKTLYEINHLAAAFYHFILTKHSAGKNALEYFTEKRNLKEETIQLFNLGYAPESWDILYRSFTKKGYKVEDLAAAGVLVQRSSGQGYIDKFRGRVMFPLTDISGKIVGFSGRVLDNSKPKYLNTPETPIFHKGSFIFALDKAKIAIKKDGAIVVEGHTDCITAHQNGFKNVVASGGTAFTTTQLQILGRYTKDLILCFDADTAGDAAIQRGIELAEKENFNIKVIVVPAPYKDLDEILNSDPNLAKEVISNPIPIYDFYLISAFKHNDKTTALGKKKIMEELTEKFGKVSNKVVLDYYIKKVSEEMDINEETVKNLFENKVKIEGVSDNSPKSREETVFSPTKKSAHEYMIALLFKAPLDIAQTFMYKLGQKDFSNPQIQEIFSELKEYILGRKHKFKIEYFISKLSEEQQKTVNDLYLWDLGEIADNDKKMEQELETTFDRLKKESAKGELKELSEKIKQAELAKDTKLINELTEKLRTLSSRLV